MNAQALGGRRNTGQHFLLALTVLFILLFAGLASVRAQAETTITMMIYPEEQDLFSQFAEEFESETNIHIQLVLPEQNYAAEMLENISRGVSVVELSGASLAQLVVNQGVFIELDPLLTNLNTSDFLPDALAFVQSNGTLYGVPLERIGCQPRYRNLAMSANSEYPNEAMQWIEYLVDADQQARILEQEIVIEQGKIYPTLRSFYEEDNEERISCDPDPFSFQPAPLDAVAFAYDVTVQMNENLGEAGLLGDERLQPFEASAAVDHENDEQPLFVIAPVAVTERLVEESFDWRLIGAISTLDTPITFDAGEGTNSVELNGEYAIYCTADIESVTGECEARGIDVDPIPLPMMVGQPPEPALFPTTTIQEGSKWACTWFIIYFCVRA